MSDTDAALRQRLRGRLEAVRLRLRDLELDATMIRGRIEEAREEELSLGELLDEPPRRKPGRPRGPSKPTAVNKLGEVIAITTNPEPPEAA